MEPVSSLILSIKMTASATTTGTTTTITKETTTKTGFPAKTVVLGFFQVEAQRKVKEAAAAAAVVAASSAEQADHRQQQVKPFFQLRILLRIAILFLVSSKL